MLARTVRAWTRPRTGGWIGTLSRAGSARWRTRVSPSSGDFRRSPATSPSAGRDPSPDRAAIAAPSRPLAVVSIVLWMPCGTEERAASETREHHAPRALPPQASRAGAGEHGAILPIYCASVTYGLAQQGDTLWRWCGPGVENGVENGSPPRTGAGSGERLRAVLRPLLRVLPRRQPTPALSESRLSLHPVQAKGSAPSPEGRPSLCRSDSSSPS